MKNFTIQFKNGSTYNLRRYDVREALTDACKEEGLTVKSVQRIKTKS